MALRLLVRFGYDRCLHRRCNQNVPLPYVAGPTRPRELGLILLPAFAAAQTPTGTISGRVIDSNGGVVRGASVSIASPSLQGTQTQTTSENGDYIFRALPPGLYTVTVQVERICDSGAERARGAVGDGHDERHAPASSCDRVGLGRHVRRHELREHGAGGGESELPTDSIRCPRPRRWSRTSTLRRAPTRPAPDGNITIAGAMSFENLFMVNGAVISDNIRSEPMRLYVEDALQEVTVATSGISAEYGRFSGGVVNAVTKSGGNMFSGSFRTEFNNDDWRTISPFDEPKADRLNPIHSFTFGGPIRAGPPLVLRRRTVRRPRNGRADRGDAHPLHPLVKGRAYRRETDRRPARDASPAGRVPDMSARRARTATPRRSMAPM